MAIAVSYTHLDVYKRQVIGGLLCATVATLVFVPSVFALIHGSESRRAAREKAKLETHFA